LSPEAKRRAIARSYANVYQRRGLIQPAPCVDCGDRSAQKHHEDYSRPLDVIWLCRSCHLKRHGREEIAMMSRAEWQQKHDRIQGSGR